MRIGSENEFVEITELGRTPQGLPTAGDVQVSVRVKLGEFEGRYDQVCLQEPVLKDFVSALVKLDESRQGSATLESASPDEFRLTVRSRDILGHMVAEVLLMRYQFSGPTYWPTSVSGGFELDSERFRSVVSAFKNFYESNA